MIGDDWAPPHSQPSFVLALPRTAAFGIVQHHAFTFSEVNEATKQRFEPAWMSTVTKLPYENACNRFVCVLRVVQRPGRREQAVINTSCQSAVDNPATAMVV